MQATCHPRGRITRCALTSLLLASIISEKQDTAAYLRVFAIALRNYGAPEAIVTDGGGIFNSLRALAIYDALDIRKERIDPGRPWQNYIEAHLYVMWNLENSHITCIMWTTSAFLLKSFQRMARVFHIIGIMRRIGDYYLNQATSWDEIKEAHRKFVRDYNIQVHFAHRERKDNRHSVTKPIPLPQCHWYASNSPWQRDASRSNSKRSASLRSATRSVDMCG